MSLNFAFCICLQSNSKNIFTIETILKIFKKQGWSVLDKDNNSVYLSTDDNLFDWKSEIISENLLVKILEANEEQCKINGFKMFHTKSNWAVTVLVNSKYDISFEFDNPPKNIDIENGLKMIDFNWYYQNLILVLKKYSFDILEIKYMEF